VDFDTTKPRSLIQAIKLDSKMRLGKARLFVQQGDTGKAMEEFKAAAEMWPGNTDLEKASSEYFTAADSSTKGVTDFDREYSSRNYRAIAEKQVQYLVFMQTDEGRKKHFEEALTRFRDAETALEKAKMLDANGDSSGAWETIHIATLSWPEDAKLNQALSQYASRAPEFISAIYKAKAAETAKKLGASMSLFALAKHKYPASQLAGDGLKRVSKEVMAPAPVAESPDSSPSPTPQTTPANPT
jgi:tetratricopeptide (TPR) repeat protein